MATKESIAVVRDNAIARLQKVMQAVSDQLHIEPVDLPLHNRDQTYLQAQQLDALAAFFERVAEAITPPVEEDLSSLTKAELEALAAERGVDLAGASKKADIIAALEASGRESEDAPEDEPEAPNPEDTGVSVTTDNTQALADQLKDAFQSDKLKE